MLHRGVAGVLAENAKRAIVENFTSIHREDLIAIEGPWRSLQSGLSQQGRSACWKNPSTTQSTVV
jgi:hypothetical protein